MTINAKPVQHGTVGATPIYVDMSRVENGASVRVQLTSNYTILCGTGIPTRPEFTGAAKANLEYPRTIAAGTILHLLAGEAAALVAAGAAAYD